MQPNLFSMTFVMAYHLIPCIPFFIGGCANIPDPYSLCFKTRIVGWGYPLLPMSDFQGRGHIGRIPKRNLRFASMSCYSRPFSIIFHARVSTVEFVSLEGNIVAVWGETKKQVRGTILQILDGQFPHHAVFVYLHPFLPCYVSSGQAP